MANAVNWFEIPATDINRAKKFYENVMSEELSLMEMGPSQYAMFPIEQGAANAPGAIVKAEGYTPSQTGALVYFSVEDIEGTLTKINKNGGSTILPKTSIGENGFMAHFNDCEGNRIALHSVQ
jgi:uncharacterized protein